MISGPAQSGVLSVWSALNRHIFVNRCTVDTYLSYPGLLELQKQNVPNQPLWIPVPNARYRQKNTHWLHNCSTEPINRPFRSQTLSTDFGQQMEFSLRVCECAAVSACLRGCKIKIELMDWDMIEHSRAWHRMPHLRFCDMSCSTEFDHTHWDAFSTWSNTVNPAFSEPHMIELSRARHRMTHLRFCDMSCSTEFDHVS